MKNHEKQKTKIFGTRPVHKFPFKIMVWTETTFQEVTGIVIFPQKTSFDTAFYIKNILKM